MEEKYIEIGYETIGVKEKRELCELVNSSLLNAFTEDDFNDVLNVFRRVIGRLEVQ